MIDVKKPYQKEAFVMKTIGNYVNLDQNAYNL